MSDALIVFEENDPLKASTTNDNNNFLLNRITETAQTIENEIDALETNLGNLISASAIPIGSVIMWSTTTPPENWIAMVGQSITNEAYADLRSVIGRDSLPNTIDRVPQGNNTPLNTIDAGLPNITGGFNLGGGNYIRIADTWGAFALGWYENNTDKGGSDPIYAARNADFNASRSSNVYGRSNTVQTNAWTTVFIIKYK